MIYLCGTLVTIIIVAGVWIYFLAKTNGEKEVEIETLEKNLAAIQSAMALRNSIDNNIDELHDKYE